MLEQMGPEFYVIAALIAIFTFLILPIAVHVFFKIESRIHIVVLVVILVVIIITRNFISEGFGDFFAFISDKFGG